MGISKRELFCEYYMDEIYEVIHEYNEMHTYKKEQPKIEEVPAESFFGF